MTILLLKGGNGTEREVSISSARGVANSLNELNLAFVELDVNPETLISDLERIRPTKVFNCIMGEWGEDGRIPLVLDLMKIPYTHSGYAASTIGMNKTFTGDVAAGLNIPYLESKIYTKNHLLSGNFITPFKCVIKPNSKGSSVCTFLLESGQKLSAEHIKEVEQAPENFFVAQKFFKGIETTIAVFGDKVIDGIEIAKPNDMFDYKTKYTQGASQFFIPPRVNLKLLEQAKQMALNIHNALGCNFASRSDFLFSENECYFLEINTHPAMTPTSLLPKILAHHGVTYTELVKALLDNAKYESKYY